MLKVTLSSGQPYDLDVGSVLRIRRSIESDALPIGKTRIDAAIQLQVLETPEATASAVKGELPSLVRFTTADGTSVWTDAKKAKGPWYVPPPNLGNGVKSAFAVGGKIQYVAEDPETVSGIISSGGGTPLPIYKSLRDLPVSDEPPLEEWD